MRVPEGRVIGICGGTCVGKTVVAEAVARALRWDCRDCGGAVIDRATAQGKQVGELELEIHEEIDKVTQRLARRTTEGIVIDGRYLCYVLAAETGVNIVELTCSRAERVRRYQFRSEVERRDAGRLVDDSDRNDRGLCAKLYRVAPRQPDCRLDTTRETADAVAMEIVRRLGREMDELGGSSVNLGVS